MVWSAERHRFELATSGKGGVKQITLNHTGAVDESFAPVDERKSGLLFAEKSSWIWDYQDSPATSPGGPTAMPTGEIPSSVKTTAPIVTTPLAKKVLLPPSYSIAGASFPEYDFPLPLRFTDSNPAGAGNVYYSINYGPWTRYLPGETVAVSSDSSIKAQVVPVDFSAWNPSKVVEELYHSHSFKLLPPEIEFDQPYFVSGKSNTIDRIAVKLSDPNEAGTSSASFQIVPVPGGGGTVTSFAPYSGPFVVNASDYPSGFGVRAYASSAKVGYEDSRMNSRFATDTKGIFGGHLDLDTSTTLSKIGSGDTDAHTHDITGKYGTGSLNFFAIPESKQIEITEGISDPSQKFKLTVVNADLSPGMSLILDYESNGTGRTLDTTVARYDDVPVEDLAVFSLSGASGTLKLKGLRVVMSQDVIHEAGIIPTTTGNVVSNVLGKYNEWRNGSLTIQAVAVNGDGSDGFLTDSSLSSGDHGAARSGLLWEAALFWHWDGESYDDKSNQYVPGQFKSVKDHVQD